MSDHPQPPCDASGGDATYTIFLRGFAATVAVRDRAERQPVRITVRLRVAHPGRDFPDDITAVMSYEGIVQDLRNLCAGTVASGPADLAGAAVALCLRYPAVRVAAVTAAVGDTIAEEATVTGDRAAPPGSEPPKKS